MTVLNNGNPSGIGGYRSPRISPVVRTHAICTCCDWESYGVYKRQATGATVRRDSTRRAAFRHIDRTGHTVTFKRIETFRPCPD